MLLRAGRSVANFSSPTTCCHVKMLVLLAGMHDEIEDGEFILELNEILPACLLLSACVPPHRSCQ